MTGGGAVTRPDPRHRTVFCEAGPFAALVVGVGVVDPRADLDEGRDGAVGFVRREDGGGAR